MFKYDYENKDWESRKRNVEEYIENNDLITKINELTIGDIVSKIDEDYDDLKQLKFELQRMYNYIIYAMDKTIFNDGGMTEEQRKVLEDNVQGIKSYIRPKRGSETYYQEPKWVFIDEDIIKHNQNKLRLFDESMGKIIDEQVRAYEELKANISQTDVEVFEERKMKRKDIISELCYDIRMCNDCRESVNRVYISEGVRQKHDILSDVDIEYDKKVIRAVLNNWNNIKVLAENNPSHSVHAIYMDFDKAMNEVKLTKRQREVLKKMIDGDSIRGYGKDIAYICSKFEKKIKK